MPHLTEQLLDTGFRNQYIKEIKSEENVQRKEEALKRFEIYRERQEKFIRQALLSEFSASTVSEMRIITSISMARRIVNELASIYKEDPERTFGTTSGSQLSEQQLTQLENMYHFAKTNQKFKAANQYYELFDQGTIQVIPSNGVMSLRVFSPFQYDVIPDPNDPEKAAAYIINLQDKQRLLSGGSSGRLYDVSNPPSSLINFRGATSQSDGTNQKIADAEDYKASLQRFVWWTKELNFVTDGKGRLINEQDQPMELTDTSLMINPLGELPFVDFSRQKDVEYWTRYGSGITEFSIEFLVLLADVFNVHKMQGFAQAIVYAETVPQNMKIGPNQILHIPLDPNKETQPRFEFASPNADMNASLELVETFLRLFLTSRGIDPKVVSGKLDTQRFSSGVERLLAMVEKFAASRDAIDMFRKLEDDVFSLMTKWSNMFQGATLPNDFGVTPFIPELQLATLPEDINMSVLFKSPETIQTKSEQEESVTKLMDAGLMSRSEAIQELREVEEEKAKEILAKIDAEDMNAAPMPAVEPEVPTEEDTPEEGVIDGEDDLEV